MRKSDVTEPARHRRQQSRTPHQTAAMPIRDRRRKTRRAIGRCVASLLLLLAFVPGVYAEPASEVVESNSKIFSEWRERRRAVLDKWSENARVSVGKVPVQGGCRVSGKTRGLDRKLHRRLCAMSRSLGPVEVISGCRKNGTRRSSESYHKVSRGCKAADVAIAGVPGRRILAYWSTGGGGRGSYGGRRFVHVDIGPDRSWHW
jgi:hypothetical protein